MDIAIIANCPESPPRDGRIAEDTFVTLELTDALKDDKGLISWTSMDDDVSKVFCGSSERSEVHAAHVLSTMDGTS